MFYAVEYPYGPDVQNTDGARANVIHSFSSAWRRDAWVAETYTGGAVRRMVGSLHPYARRWREYGMEHPLEAPSKIRAWQVHDR